MPTSKELETLVINKVENEEVFKYMKENGLVNQDELYLVEGDDANYEFDIENVVLTSSGSVTVTDSRIKSTNTGTFIPDLSVDDLVSNVSVTCNDGSATVYGTTSYDIPGTLKII